MSPPDLSIALVNWNAFALTRAALTSIREHTSGIAYEVIVVDNGSNREEKVEDLPTQFPWITFISNATNRGFTKANNQAIRCATGRYVVLLNNDTVQTSNALGASVKYMDSHPEVGALGILHLNNDERHTLQSSHYSFPSPWCETGALIGLCRQHVCAPAHADIPPEADVDWVCGSFLLMRRECLESVGMLDERFFIYDEDIDWCRRARNSGWRVRFWQGASMIHLGAASNPLMRDKTFVMFRSHLSYIFKHHGFFAGSCYYLAMGLRLTRATAWQTLRILVGRGRKADFDERFNRQMQFLALCSGRLGG